MRLIDASADIEAAFLPGVGMVGASLRHRGEELLGRTDNLVRYESEGSTMGIPLLHPWANRIAGTSYDAAGRSVQLDPGSALLHLDANGLPIHGIVGPRLPWRVLGSGADDLGAQLVAEADLSTPEMLAVFPFAHRVRQTVSLAADGLTVETTITPSGDTPVPVSFGYHPYLTLPGVPREAQLLEVPPMRRLLLDAHGIPTGSEEPYAGLAGGLDRDYDDGFAGVADGATFALSGGSRRVEVTFLDGYPFAQIFAPPGQDFICFEPMTAPTNALSSGDGLRLAEPGGPFTASFRISVS
jgi:galactose mutarotase-like enzyme